MSKTSKTSWGPVANWYNEYLQNADTYQSQVILPNLARLLNLQPTDSILELGCGQGYFLEKFLAQTKNVFGADISPELIKLASQKISQNNLQIASADDSKLFINKKFNVVTIILAIQNMKNLNGVIENVSRLLAENGRVYLVLNHPAFRIPQNSDWGFDEQEKIQYRRVDKYQSEIEIEIDMNPGKTKNKIMTKTYHRPLQLFSKTFAKNNLAITKIEEWISHKQSQSGPRAKAEDNARKEIPMFMCLELKKIL